jgi:hypothetical protein
LDNLLRAHTALIRAPDLAARCGYPPAWMSWLPVGAAWAAVLAIDGRELWLVHWHYFPDDPDYETFDIDRGLHDVFGDESFDYEIVQREDWTGKRLSANAVRAGRAFLCGDAAHLWIPFAGYGMNAGIADAQNLAWMLDGVLSGWAPPSLLDAYAAERMPITDRVSRFTSNLIAVLKDVHPELMDRNDDEGRLARETLGARIYDANLPAIVPKGLNFGYCYDESPVIAHDGELPPPFTMGTYEPSLVPGCRLPHVFLKDGRSLYDLLGPGFSLLRLDPAIEVDRFVAEAVARGVPIAVCDVQPEEVEPVYGSLLVLVRPDQHIAWRGDRSPANPGSLIDLVCGGPVH